MIRRSLAVACTALLLLATAIAGCGSSSSINGSGQERQGEEVDASGPVEGKLTISQWPLYIDPGKNGTLAEFEKETGVDVKWVEDINDNAEYLAKMQPLLAKGESGGRSLITVSDWLAKKMYDLGYIEKLDYSHLPNVKANLIPALQHPEADPNRDFTVPWQAG